MSSSPILDRYMPIKDLAERRAYNREYYHKHLGRCRKLKIARSAIRLSKNKVKAWEYLLSHPCGCGEVDPIVLDFDHDDASSKKEAVSVMIGHGWSWKSIEEEIAKCTVRCRNCHARRTAKQLGYYSWLPIELAGREGLEPPKLLPKSSVLPLNDLPV